MAVRQGDQFEKNLLHHEASKLVHVQALEPSPQGDVINSCQRKI